MYLVKHSRPDICNSVRELTKVMVEKGEDNYKMMFRVIKYVLTTKDKGIKYHIKNKDMNLVNLLTNI